MINDVEDLKKANQILHALLDNREAEIKRLREELSLALREITDLRLPNSSGDHNNG
jgi:predicted RNase H-like nuclease (RuvC/YqgF family)